LSATYAGSEEGKEVTLCRRSITRESVEFKGEKVTKALFLYMKTIFNLVQNFPTSTEPT